MIPNPQSFFRFATKFYPLLSDLYYRTEGLSDGNLFDLIGRHLAPDDPSCEHIMDRLVKLCIIETVPGDEGPGGALIERGDDGKTRRRNYC